MAGATLGKVLSQSRSAAAELKSLEICRVFKHLRLGYMIEVRTSNGRRRRENFAASSGVITSEEVKSQFDCLPGIGQSIRKGARRQFLSGVPSVG